MNFWHCQWRKFSSRVVLRRNSVRPKSVIKNKTVKLWRERTRLVQMSARFLCGKSLNLHGTWKNRCEQEPVWPDCKIIFQYLAFTIMKIWPILVIKIAKVCSKCCQNTKQPWKYRQILIKLIQSGEISPNLVTLAGTLCEWGRKKENQQFIWSCSLNL